MIISENIFVKYAYGASCGNGKLEERNDYYPFGGLMGKDLNGDFNPTNTTARNSNAKSVSTYTTMGQDATMPPPVASLRWIRWRRNITRQVHLHIV